MANSPEKQDPGDRLSHDDVLLLSRQIAALAASGLPLGPGLRATAEELPNGRLRTTIGALADAIDRGEPLDKAMLARGESLPKHLQGIVLAGVRSGKLSHVLGEFVALTNVGVEIRRRLWISLLYPLMAMFLAMAILIFACSWLVASFATIFRDFGVNISELTRTVIAFSNFLVQQGPALLTGLAVIAFLYLGARIFLSTATRRGLATHVPILGRVWKSTAIAEFCHLLGLLLECEIPLSTALGLTGLGVQNSEIERACLILKKDVEQGMSLSNAVRDQRLFPAGIVRILKWAEGHRGLPESLHMTGDILEARASVQASLAGTIFTILAIFLIVFGAGSVTVAIYLPMIQLINRLSG